MWCFMHENVQMKRLKTIGKIYIINPVTVWRRRVDAVEFVTWLSFSTR